MLKCLKRLSCILGIGVISFTLIPSSDANAVDLSTAVSPSKISDQQIDYGESKTFKIFGANKSKDLPDMSLKNDISIEVSVEDEYGDKVDCDGLVSIDKNKFSLAPENEDCVNVTVTPKSSESVPEGDYKVYVDFIQKPIEWLPMNNQTNVIRVPILVFIGNKEDYNSRECDFIVSDVDLLLGGEKTTVFKEIVNGCKKVLNPLKIVSAIDYVREHPNYLFKTKDGLVADINNSAGSSVSLRDVMVNSEDKLSNSQYVYCTDSALNKSVKSCKKCEDEVLIILEDDETISISCSDVSGTSIFSQIQNIARSTKNCTLSELATKLEVPSLKNFSKENPTLQITLENKGQVAVTAKGDYKLTLNSSEEICNNTVVTPTLYPEESCELQDVLTSKSLSNGEYSVDGVLKFRDLEKPFNLKFSVNSLRVWVIVGIIVFFILYITIILIIIIYILSKLFRKKPELIDKNGNKINYQLMSMDIGKYHKSKKDKELKHVKSTKIVMPTEFKFEVKFKGSIINFEECKISILDEPRRIISDSNVLTVDSLVLGEYLEVSFNSSRSNRISFVIRLEN